jgi:hypothetical protein
MTETTAPKIDWVRLVDFDQHKISVSDLNQTYKTGSHPVAFCTRTY